MTVYVRWYGNILEGELLDSEYLGMKQVRIPLDGHKPIALFTPEHVNQTMAEALAGHEEFTPAEVKNKKFEVTIDPQPDVLPADNQGILEAFKVANWDQERNHLRIDKLEEFYQLWRMVMKPDGFVEAEAPVVTLPSHKPEVDPIEVVPQNETPIQQPQSHKPEKPKPSKKMLRSTGTIEYNDSTQLSIF